MADVEKGPRVRIRAYLQACRKELEERIGLSRCLMAIPLRHASPARAAARAFFITGFGTDLAAAGAKATACARTLAARLKPCPDTNRSDRHRSYTNRSAPSPFRSPPVGPSRYGRHRLAAHNSDGRSFPELPASDLPHDFRHRCVTKGSRGQGKHQHHQSEKR